MNPPRKINLVKAWMEKNLAATQKTSVRKLIHIVSRDLGESVSRDTCYMALRRLKWDMAERGEKLICRFDVDPPSVLARPPGATAALEYSPVPAVAPALGGSAGDASPRPSETDRHRAMREKIAAELECQLGMGCFDDACNTVTREDCNYVTRVVISLLQTLRATPVKGA
jgi:hypothetical protein